jgi:hypothetical protein
MALFGDPSLQIGGFPVVFCSFLILRKVLKGSLLTFCHVLTLDVLKSSEPKITPS